MAFDEQGNYYNAAGDCSRWQGSIAVIEPSSPVHQVEITTLPTSIRKTDEMVFVNPLSYFGLSKTLADPGNEQKLEDALKVMELLATEEGQKSLPQKINNYIASLKNETIPADSPFREVEETARLQADAFRQAAGTDMGLVSLGGYHDGFENYSGVCGKLFAGEISEEIVNAVVPGLFQDPICTLTLSGAKLKTLLETGFVTAEGVKGFPYAASGLELVKNPDGTVKQVAMEDGSPLDEAAAYTVAMDKGSFTEEIGQKGAAEETDLIVREVVADYFSKHSPLSPEG